MLVGTFRADLLQRACLLFTGAKRGNSVPDLGPILEPVFVAPADYFLVAGETSDTTSVEEVFSHGALNPSSTAFHFR